MLYMPLTSMLAGRLNFVGIALVCESYYVIINLPSRTMATIKTPTEIHHDTYTQSILLRLFIASCR
jgi:hypothetical protein